MSAEVVHQDMPLMTSLQVISRLRSSNDGRPRSMTRNWLASEREVAHVAERERAG